MYNIQEIDISKIKHELSLRNIPLTKNVAYILPEQFSDNGDILNSNCSDIKKDLEEFGIKTIVVKGKNYTSLGLRSVDIILPLIFGIPFNVFSCFIYDWIKNYLPKGNKIKIRYIVKQKDTYQEITIEGDANKVNQILNTLKDNFDE